MTKKPSSLLPRSAKRKQFQLSLAPNSDDTALLVNDVVQSLANLMKLGKNARLR